MRSVLLVNLGTAAAPEPEAVRAFLSEFLSDPMVVDYPAWLWAPILRKILRSRPEKVAAMYRSIWLEEGSPLEAGTRRVALALRAAVPGLEVDFAYRYGAPSLGEALSRAETALVVVPLFPQRTGSTTGTIEKLVERAERDVLLARVAPDDPGYIEAQASRFLSAVPEAPPEHLVVSFHGIPLRYDRAEKGVYRSDCDSTYFALLERLDWSEKHATLSFQSRFGPEPWLRPATASVLERLGRSGIGRVAVATPGFVTEGLETAEEIGIRGKETFLEAGGSSFLRVPVVEAHPAFVESLARTVTTPSPATK